MPRLQTLKQRTTPVAWLLGTLLAFAPLGPHAAAAVLCFGADGHVTAELAGGSRCADAPADVPVDTDASHCEVCIDVPLPSGGDADCASFTTERAPTAQVVLPVAALLPAPHHLQATSQAASYAHDGGTAPPIDPAPLRSVVLLI